MLRARTQRSGDSIGDFNNRLDVLGRTNGHQRPAPLRPPASSSAVAPIAPRRSQEAAFSGPAPGRVSAAQRRRTVVQGLAIFNIVVGLLAAVTGSTPFFGLLVLGLVLLGAYLGLWAWVRSAQAERAQKVRYLPAAQRAPELALRRTASS